MSEKKKYIGVVCFLAGTLFLSTQCQAKGQVIIKPFVKSSFENNSNFWKSEDNEVSVNTYTVKPGVELGYQTPKLDVALDASVDLYWYDDQDTPPDGVRDASEDDYTGVTGTLYTTYMATDRVTLTLDDQLYVTRDPADADVNSNSTSREKYTINYFEPGVIYDFADKFGLGVKYRNTITEYDEDDVESSVENRGIFDLYYYLNSSSSLFLDYSLWERDYDQDSSDYVSNVVSLNYQRQFNFFSILAGGGYHHRAFDVDTIDDTDMFSWKVDVIGQDPDTSRADSKSYLMLSIGQEPNDDTTGDQIYMASFARFEGAHKLWQKLEGTVRASYMNTDYETTDQDDDTYLGAIGLSYRAFDLLTVGLEGGVESRDSNFDGESYDDTFVMLTLDVAYDFGSK
ncbi:outer membrane beta-barrel protein [Desulforhopalus sp. 52FAK]